MRICLLVLCLLCFGCQENVKDNLKIYENKSAAEIYAKAKALQADGDNKESEQAFSALRAFHPESDLVKKSLRESLTLNLKAKKYQEVIDISENMTNWYPGTDMAALGYYTKGNALISMHRTWLQKKVKVDPADLSHERLEQAIQSYLTLIAEFPKSKFVKPSRKKISKINLYLAQHEINVAKFYLNRGHKLAAAMRARDAVKIDARVINDAKIILAKTGRGAAW